MDKYVVRVKDASDLPSYHQLVGSATETKRPSLELPTRKSSWLAAYEINGGISPLHQRSLLNIRLGCYSEVGSFEQACPRERLPLSLIRADLVTLGGSAYHRSQYVLRPYVSCIDFDSKGIYLASLNSSGCLAIHEFETLFCNAAKGSDDDYSVFTRYNPGAREAVKWNPANQDEVACVLSLDAQVCFYNFACDDPLPFQILKVKSIVDVHSLQDLSISKSGSSRVLACGRGGNVPIWDGRAGTTSISVLTVPDAAGALNCLQLSHDEQVVYAGSTGGFIYTWDLRGGTRAAAFTTCGEIYHQPLGAVKLATLFSNISSLRAQTEIGVSAVHAISLDTFGTRLGFHLNNGWSGVIDLASLDITHLHCPPPWFDDAEVQAISGSRIWYPPRPDVRKRRPAWLPSYPVYAVGSASQPQIHMLDFFPGPNSRQSIYHECSDTDSCEIKGHAGLSTSDVVVVLAAHPLNNELVAGTQGGRLLLVGQKTATIPGEDIECSSQDDCNTLLA